MQNRLISNMLIFFHLFRTFFIFLTAPQEKKSFLALNGTTYIVIKLKILWGTVSSTLENPFVHQTHVVVQLPRAAKRSKRAGEKINKYKTYPWRFLVRISANQRRVVVLYKWGIRRNHFLFWILRKTAPKCANRTFSLFAQANMRNSLVCYHGSSITRPLTYLPKAQSRTQSYFMARL